MFGDNNDSFDGGQAAQPKARKNVRHFDEPGHAHFLTFSCYHRLALLGKDRTRRWLVDSIDAARRKHGFDLWGWVIMPEHVHLLVWPKSANTLIQAVLADVKRTVGQLAIAWLQANRPDFLERLTVRNRRREYRRFWQAGPGQDRNVFDPNAAHQILEYIHNNPIRRGLANTPEGWFWSSAADWSGNENSPLKVNKTVPESIAFFS